MGPPATAKPEVADDSTTTPTTTSRRAPTASIDGGATTATSRSCPSGWPRAGRRLPQPIVPWCASRRSATPGRPLRPRPSRRRRRSRPATQRSQPRRASRSPTSPSRNVRPAAAAADGDGAAGAEAARKKRRRGVKGPKPVSSEAAVDLDADTIERRRGRERNGRPVGRYLMAVQVRPTLDPDRGARGPHPDRALRRRARPTTSARSTATSTSARCRTCCPAWRPRSSTSARRRTPCSTAATCSTTPRTSSRSGASRRIEQMLQAQADSSLCQVTKNPIGAKGARLTQEVSLPGPVRRAHPQPHDLRHLQAAARRRAQAAAQHPRPGQARRSTA